MIKHILTKLEAQKDEAANIHITVGFDGFIDEIARVVKQRSNQHDFACFSTITEFSQHTCKAAGRSADMELVIEKIKLGGNAPIMANALANFGIQTTCIGAMGFPEVREAFRKMAPNCQLISVCNPGAAQAFEFNDGKLMFANLKPLEDLSWERVIQTIGLQRLLAIFEQSRMISLVDWSIAYSMGGVWRGILEEVFPKLSPKENSQTDIFFDLADPTKRTDADIINVLSLIDEYSRFGNVTLGLNENEARHVFAIFNQKTTPSVFKEDPGLEYIGKFIFERMRITTLLIHPLDGCLAFQKDVAFYKKGRLVRNPKISTGGGDNFNAGFCLGRVLGFETGEAVFLGMAASGAYVTNGESPSIQGLIDYLSGWQASGEFE